MKDPVVSMGSVDSVHLFRNSIWNDDSTLALLMDLDGLILDLNPAMAGALGKSVEELKGTRLWQSLSSDDVARCREALQQLVESRKPQRLESSWQERRYEALLRPCLGQKGEVIGVTMVSAGTTDQHRHAGGLEQNQRRSEEEFRAFVCASSDVVYRMNPDWSEMRQLHGLDFLADTEAPETEWLEKYIYADDQTRVLGAIDAAIRSKSVFELEHRVRRADGTAGWTSK